MQKVGLLKSAVAPGLRSLLGEHLTDLKVSHLAQEPDRTWHDVEVPLRQYAAQTITLTLETDPGPHGDTAGDWAGWEMPRIVYAGAQ